MLRYEAVVAGHETNDERQRILGDLREHWGIETWSLVKLIERIRGLAQLFRAQGSLDETRMRS